jgi:hypothetical protein
MTRIYTDQPAYLQPGRCMCGTHSLLRTDYAKHMLVEVTGSYKGKILCLQDLCREVKFNARRQLKLEDSVEDSVQLREDNWNKRLGNKTKICLNQ